MHTSRQRARSAWVLPIVLLLCAVMVAPASAVLSRPAVPSGAASTGTHAAAGASGPLGSHAAPTGHTPAAVRNLGQTPSIPATTTQTSLPQLSSAANSPKWLAYLDAGSNGAGRPKGYIPLVSPPNLGLVGDRAAGPATITPGYQAPPAPLGLADYGVGASGNYAYSTSSFLATVDLTSPPNVTAPSSEGVIDPSGSDLGLVGSPYEFSLQLNTIGSNLTEPGTSNGTVWAQNVLDINGSAIHFVDDVWNLTAYSGFGFSLNAIVSGCSGADVPFLIELEGGVYQCVGGSIPISAADYPLSIQLYNNASVNAEHESVIAFGAVIWGDGTLLYAGDYDTLVFANPTGAAPVDPIGYTVSGFTRSPAQPSGFPELLQDAEIIFGGPIGGSNAVFRSLDGSLALQYWQGGAWQNIRSGFNFGSDTGETSVGIAGYWTTAGVEEINQGPSFLYGLWGTPANLGVAAGAIQFQGSIDESYGFVFVSNVVPGADDTNLSYVPTTVAGTFDSWLPPSIPATGGVYYTEAFAPGNVSVSGAPFSTSQTGYTFPVAAASPTIDAPLYMDTDAQAESLAYNLTGYSVGSGDPFYFFGLVVNLPLAFTHVNDYDFPTFVAYQSEQLTIPALYFDDYEGGNVPGGDLNFTLDYSLTGNGWFTPPPSTVGPWPNYTNQFNAWGSYIPVVGYVEFTGALAYNVSGVPVSGTQGGVAFFFGDVGAEAGFIDSTYGSYGVANIASLGTYVIQLNATTGANALDDIGSWDTYGFGLNASGYYDGSTSVAVYALSSHYGYFQDLTASDGAYGFYAGADEGAGLAFGLPGAFHDTIYNLSAYDDSLGVGLAFSTGVNVTQANIGFDALGAYVENSFYTYVTNLTTVDGWGVDLYQANYTYITNFTEIGFEDGSDWYASSYTYVTNAEFDDYFEAVDAEDDNYTVFTNTTVLAPYEVGVLLEGMLWTTFVDLTVEDATTGAAGVVVAFSNQTTFTTTYVYDTTDNGAGIVAAYDYDTSFADTQVATVADGAYGLYLFVDAETTVTDAVVEDVAEAQGIWGIGLENTTFEYLSVYAVYDFGVGLIVEQSSGTLLLYGYGEAISAYGAAFVFEYDSVTYVQYSEVADIGPIAWGLVLYETNEAEIYVFEGALIGSGGTAVLLEYANDTLVIGTDLFEISFGAVGLQGYGISNTTIFDTTIYEASVGINLTYSNSTLVAYTSVDDAEYGVELTHSTAISVYAVYVDASRFGVLVNASTLTSVQYVQSEDSFLGVGVENSTATTVSDVWADQTDFAGVYLLNDSGATVSSVWVNDTFGVWVNATSAAEISGVTANDSAIGVVFLDTSGDAASGLVATNDSEAAVIDPSTDLSLDGVSASNDSTGVVVLEGSHLAITNVTATDDSTGVNAVGNSNHLSVSDVSASYDSTGVFLTQTTNYVTVTTVQATHDSEGVATVDDSSHIAVDGVVAADGSFGVFYFGGFAETASDVSAENLSLGVAIVDTNDGAATDVTATGLSVGVGVFFASNISVDDVTATNTTTSLPWSSGFNSVFGLPASAVFLADDFEVNVSSVAATHYPFGLFSVGSDDLAVQDVNATEGAIGVQLNGTDDSVFVGLGLYADTLGLVVQDDSTGNIVFESQFVNDTGYGVDLLSGAYGNLVYDNSFVGDNGANNQTYQPAHVQAYSWTADNQFNSTSKIGNYWAEWHVYSGGVLAPYYIANGAWDYHPLGAGEEKSTITFSASNVPPGVRWSLTVGTTTQSTLGNSLVFAVNPGTYDWSIAPITGWQVTPDHGVVVVPDGAISVNITFSKLYTVTFTESGLPVSTAWSVILNGSLQSGSSASIAFSRVAGTYAYAVVAPAGWAASPATGTVSVSGSYLVLLAFSSTTVPTYVVYVNETGLASGTTWSAVFNGVEQSTTGTSLAFAAGPGTYAYQIDPVSGYTASTTGGTAYVSGPYTITVAYAATTGSGPVKVTLVASGLPAHTDWSAYLGGAIGSSDGGSEINFTVTAGGTYSYQVVPVADYAAGHGSGTFTVGSTTYVVLVAFHAVTYSVTFGVSGLTGGTAWSVEVDGTTYASSGTSLTVALANGTHDYTFGSVSGYSVSDASGTLSVAGGPAGVSVAYSPTSSTSYVAGSTFNTDLAIAVGLAVVAIIVAVVALLRKPRAPVSTPPASWQEGPRPGTDSTGTTPSQGSKP